MVLRGTGAFASSTCGLFLMPSLAVPIPFGLRCFIYGDFGTVITIRVFGVSSPQWNTSFMLPNDSGLVGARAMIQGIYVGGSTPGWLVLTNGVDCQAGY
jgi:hypothetical protein